MYITRTGLIACPLDELAMTYGDKQISCPNGHSFDIARQGYINLLPVQHKRSKHPGDSAEMVSARTDFLNSGAYAPIADGLNAIVLGVMSANNDQKQCLLDAGCGEGYYLEQLLHAIEHAPGQQSIELIGLDISKPAIVAAARRSRQITWLIASNRHPPALAGSVDIILCLFGFPVYESFRKLLKPTGHIILVESAPEHLVELRNVIYPAVNKAPPPDLTNAMAAGFVLCRETTLSYTRTLEKNAQIMNLLMMTPHYFRASYEGKQAASQLNRIAVTVDVVFRVLALQK